MRRANNCEIMLTKIKMPLQDMVVSPFYVHIIKNLRHILSIFHTICGFFGHESVILCYFFIYNLIFCPFPHILSFNW